MGPSVWFALLCGMTQIALYFSWEIGIPSPFSGQHRFLELFVSWLFLLVAATFPSLAIKGIRKILKESKEELSELQEAKRTLEESEARYRLLVDGSPDAILLHEYGKITYVNPGGLKLLGASSTDDLIGREISSFLHPDSWGLIRDDVAALGESRVSTPICRAKAVGKNNSIIEIEIVSSLAERSSKSRIQTVMRDITERTQLEQQLLQSQRLEELGQLVGGVAHDLNNILGVVIGHNQIMAKWKTDEQRLSKSLEAADKAAKRGANLVKQLLTFARKVEFTMEPVAIDKVVKEIASLVKATFPENISVMLRLEEALPLVNADPNQLYQVFLNLCVNARDAMPFGGSLTISTSVAAPGTVKSRFREAREDGYVRVDVTDTGTGIEQEQLERIFEPFFTTKKEGHGTGLGLSVVYGIVKSHRGYISVQSEVGWGTSFSVFLPVTKSPTAVTGKKPIMTQAISGKGETILVVEDDEFVREYEKTILEDSGYEVVTAGDGLEALTIFRERRHEISLAIMDMGLPKMNGVKVMAEIRRAMPDVRVILTSGYADPDVKAEAMK